MANNLTKLFGQPVVVENRPGAAGNTGVIAAARAEPDGYTLVMVVNTFATGAALNPAAYDPLGDFAPVGLVARNGFVLVRTPSLKAQSVQELVAMAKAAPSKLVCLGWSRVAPTFVHGAFQVPIWHRHPAHSLSSRRRRQSRRRSR